MSQTQQPSNHPGSSHRVQRFVWLLVLVAVILAVWGVVTRVIARNELTRQTIAAAVPFVTTLKAASSPATEELVLPGDVRAFAEAPIYARTSGYLRRWYTDIGTAVKQGQLLAEIDTPEVDQQLIQVEHELATAEANARLAASTHERWKGLLAKKAVSQQDADARAADAVATQATAASARANLARLRQLESFKRVVAPFSGVVTARNTDVGALINAGESAGAALFRVVDKHILRVYVRVPESYATQVIPGIGAELAFSEHPHKLYPAKVVRTAEALDPTARTLQVELQVDNTKGELFPGAYTSVRFKIPGSAGTLRVPVSTLMFRAAGLQVATVSKEGKVTLKSIVQGRDFGRSVEVLSGLAPEDEIIANPPDSLYDGAPVRFANPAPSSGVPADAPAGAPVDAATRAQGEGRHAS